MTIASVVHVLCAVTSLVCAILLWRGYRASGARLLKWSGFCFMGLFLNNLLLVIDTHTMLALDLALIRTVPALVGVGCIIYGLVWDSDE